MDNSPISIHFNSIPHDLPTDLSIQPIEITKEFSNEKDTTQNRRQREHEWIKKLNTMHPNGLNRNKGQPITATYISVPYSKESTKITRHLKNSYQELQIQNTHIQFPKKIIVSYKRHKNIKNILCPSKLTINKT